MDYLSTLNPEQRAAVEQTEGPVMIIAGAGSGKTRVITYRIAHLLQKGVQPFNILALTFTNKAARAMRERIYDIAGPDAKSIWMGTFHSVFAKILRIEADKIGYPSNFTIYDTDDSKSVVKSILKELQLDDKLYNPNFCFNRISSAKNNLISPEAYLTNEQIQADDNSAGRDRIGEIYASYAKRCFKAGAMDFDDLLYKTNILIRDNPEVLYKYQNKFKYLMVDEYQDTNYSQYLIVKKLVAIHENLCVVGDDAQSIYAFRGATIQNILNFEKDYPDLKIFKLEQNYRSTQNIVNSANRHYIVDNTVRAILNKYGEVKIGNVYYTLTENGYAEATDLSTIISFRKNGALSNVKLEDGSSSGNSNSIVCTSHKRNDGKKENGNNSKKYEWVVSHYTYPWGRYATAKLDNYEKKRNRYRRFKAESIARAYGDVSVLEYNCYSKREFNGINGTRAAAYDQEVKHHLNVTSNGTTSQGWVKGYFKASDMEHTQILNW